MNVTAFVLQQRERAPPVATLPQGPVCHPLLPARPPACLCMRACSSICVMKRNIMHVCSRAGLPADLYEVMAAMTREERVIPAAALAPDERGCTILSAWVQQRLDQASAQQGALVSCGLPLHSTAQVQAISADRLLCLQSLAHCFHSTLLFDAGLTHGVLAGSPLVLPHSHHHI